MSRWITLRIRFDTEILQSLDDLPHRVREDIFHALQKYATTGEGGTVAMRAPGSFEYDVLVVSGYDVEFDIYRDEDPAMFVLRVERHAASLGDD